MTVVSVGFLSSRHAAAAVLVVVAGCSGTNADPDTGFQGARGGITVVPAADRQAAPDIAGPDLDGKQLALSDFRGKTVVLNVWGSWCGPCVAETPDFVAASKQLAAKDVQFLGIAIRERAETSKRFVQRKGVPYPSISDPSSSTLLGFRKNLPSVAVPTTYVVDAQGRLAARILLRKTTRTTLADVVEDVQKDS